MIRVTTSSRLHFGLLSLAADGTYWPDRHGELVLPARRFGSVGLMIDKPGIRLTAMPASEWSAEGPLAERALAFAQRFASSGDFHVGPHRLVVEHCPPEHVGLGVGTQLGMAVAKVLAVSAGVGHAPHAASAGGMRNMPYGAAELARCVGRGLRSGLGVHGFEQGGFLVDGGKGAADDLAPLLAWMPFPEEWRVVLVLPPQSAGRHGHAEHEAFARLADANPFPAQTDALCRLVLLGMLPALREADLPAFGEALFDFNARVGEMFAAAQGGTYASPFTAEVVSCIRGLGVRGVGQSSWGPVVFAVTGNEETARDVARRIRHQFTLPEKTVIVTSGCNHSAQVQDLGEQ